MFKYLACCAIIGIAAAGVAVSRSEDANADVTLLKSDVRPDGFDYALETSNKISAQQSGDEHGNVQGNFEWISPEGEHVKVTYVADENGYQPKSDLLPTPPPIPEAILRAIAYNEAHPQVNDDKKN